MVPHSVAETQEVKMDNWNERKKMIGPAALFFPLLSSESIQQAMSAAQLIYLWWFIGSLGFFLLALITLNL